jgi:hypothetical protein
MKILGHPLTWRTTCFIGVGCSAVAFAHTNGAGDFVLFDSLGDPWPIHACYLNRRRQAGSRWTIDFDVEVPKPKKVWKSANDIRRANAMSFLSSPLFHVVGYLQEHHMKKRDDWIAKAGNLGSRVIWKVLNKFPDQFTIVTGDPNAGLQSFTAFADLSKLKPRKKDMLRATLRAVTVIGPKDRPVVFVADNVSVLRW